jgi:ribosomal protein S18 acetylase RimI-like enzyme
MISLRPTRPEDSAALLRIAGAEPLFSPEEAATVDELLTDYLTRADHHGYHFLTAEIDGQVVGFSCHGPTPMTTGTFDLYWICIDAGHKGQGLGKALLAKVEAEVRNSGGRMIVLDTSGRPDYAPTRAFYEHAGYTRTALIPEFYAPGDDLVVYTRMLI